MISTGYPLYAAAFSEPTTLIVGGGGGEGNHGVQNKLTALNILTGEVVAEQTLASDEDNPTCLAVAGDGTIYAGANRGEAAIKAGKNRHLRVIGSDLVEKDAVDLFGTTNPEVYQKAIAVSDELVAAVADGGSGGVYVADRKDSRTVWHVAGETNDAAFSPDGSLLAVATPKEIVVFDAREGKKRAIVEVPVTLKSAVWTRVAFASNSQLVGAINRPKQTPVVALAAVSGAHEGEVSRMQHLAGKSITCLASAGGLVAAATAAGDIYVYDGELRPLQRFKGAHSFPVTALAVSNGAEGPIVAATSLDGSVFVRRVEPSTLKATIGWVLISSVLIVVLALISVRLVEKDLWDTFKFRAPNPNQIAANIQAAIASSASEAAAVPSEAAVSASSAFASASSASAASEDTSYIYSEETTYSEFYAETQTTTATVTDTTLTVTSTVGVDEDPLTANDYIQDTHSEL